MNKKLAIITAIFFLAGNMTLLYGQNLAVNGGFEEDILGNISMWNPSSFLMNDASTLMVPVEGISHSGKRSLLMVNHVPNDSRLVQWVGVEPDTHYRISAWVLVEQAGPNNKGANLSVFGSSFASSDIRGTFGKWAELSVVGKTGIDQTALPVCVRLGFYGSLNFGKVYFDDVEVVRLDATPPGKVFDFSANTGTGIVGFTEEPENTVEASPVNLILIIISSGLTLALLLMILQKAGFFPFRKKRQQAQASTVTKHRSVKKGREEAEVERRRAPRKKLKLDVNIWKNTQDGGTQFIQLKSIDFSLSGAFVHSEDLSILKIDEKIHLQVVFKNKDYAMGPARIARKQESISRKGKSTGGGFGIEFLSFDEQFLKNRKVILK